MAIIYKIRRKSDGLFSKGGMSPEFTKAGKMWKHKGHIRSHLNLLYRTDLYKDCEIVEYELSEQQKSPGQALEDFIRETVDIKAEAAKKRKERNLQWEKFRRHREYLKLQKEFE